MTSLAATLFDLRRIAAAAPLAGDYKALVCVFLYGGNDGNNILVPRGSDYAPYAAARGGLALPQASLLPHHAALDGDGRQWGLHPSLPGLQSLFNAAAAALVANVGPLVAPVTRGEYLSRHGRAAAAALLAQRPDGALADLAARPAGAHRLGRPRRRPAALRSTTTRRSRCRSRWRAPTPSRSANAVTQYQVSPERQHRPGLVLRRQRVEPSASRTPSASCWRGAMATFSSAATATSSQRALDQDRLLSGALAAAPPLAHRSSRTPTSAGSSR